MAAWGFHSVVARWTGSRLGGFVAACTFLTTPWVLWVWMPMRPVNFVLVYFPWIILLLSRRGWQLGRGIALGVLVVLQSLADPIYVAPAVFAPASIVALWRVLRPHDRADGLRLTATLLLALLVLTPIYVLYRQSLPDTGLGPIGVWSAQPETSDKGAVGALVLAGGVYAQLRPIGVPWIAMLFAVAGLVSFALRTPRERTATLQAWKHVGLWIGVGVLISTPALVVLGEPNRVLRSPLFLLAEWLAPSVVSLMRGAMRLGIGALAGLVLAAGLGFAECERRIAPRVRCGSLVLAAILVGVMYAGWPGRGGPYPIDMAPSADTPVVAALRRSKGPVLELPAGLRGSDSTSHARAMYRSIFYLWRPLLNGYSSYWPEGFPQLMELANQLPDRHALARLRSETGVEMVLVHRFAQNREDWMQMARRDDGPFRFVAADGDSLLFAVRD
jgi:hypothetical protein